MPQTSSMLHIDFVGRHFVWLERLGNWHVLDLYEDMVRKHTEKDKEVTWKELDNDQKVAREHISAIVIKFGVGAREGSRNKSR